MKGLTHKAVIYIPGTVNANQEATSEMITSAVNKIASELSNMFGDATAQKVNGYWMSQNEGLIEENITQVYAFAKRITKKDRKKLEALCNWLKEAFTQEAISLEIDNALYFV